MCFHAVDASPKRGTQNQSSRGFTLLEVLIAIALLALVSSALYGTYFSLLRGRETAVAGMEARRELRTTIDMLRRELTAAFYRKDNKKLHFLVEDRDFFGKPASTLDFTTIAPPRSGDVPLSDQVAVRYRSREQDGKILLSREARDVYQTGASLPYPQMEEVEGFLVECFDGGKWVRTWDTELNPSLPKSVKVTVRVKEGDKTVEFAAVASPRIAGN